MGVNLRILLNIRKELEVYNGNYEFIAAQKLHSNCSNKKRSPEFLDEILAMISNDPKKSIKSIAWNTEVSEFLISLVE